MNKPSKKSENEVLEKIKKHKRLKVAQEKQHQRRCQQALYFKELAYFLPFERETLNQLDYSSLLQLTIAYLKMKHIIKDTKINQKPDLPSIEDNVKRIDHNTASNNTQELVQYSRSNALNRELHQRLMRQTMDGFLLVVDNDGTILFVSESVRRYLGFFEMNLITKQLYDVIIEGDQEDVSQILHDCELKAMTSKPGESIDCSFFCRMKCQHKASRALSYSMSSSYKLMYVSGNYKVANGGSRLVAMVTPVSTPSILEIAVEGNMFVTHYTLDMKCSFYDGRLQEVLGYSKQELTTSLLFDFHHHDDILMCQKCAQGVLEKGEGVSGYYRFVAKSGTYIWLQTRAALVCDSRTGKPRSLVCFNFVISQEEAEKSTPLRQLTNGTTNTSDMQNLSTIPSPATSSTSSSSNMKKSPLPFREEGLMFDPVPVTTDKWKNQNPLNESSTPYSPPFSPTSDDRPCSVATNSVSSPSSTVLMSSTSSISSSVPLSHEMLEDIFSANGSPEFPSQIPDGTSLECGFPDWGRGTFNNTNVHQISLEQYLQGEQQHINMTGFPYNHNVYSTPFVSEPGSFELQCSQADTQSDSQLIKLLTS